MAEDRNDLKFWYPLLYKTGVPTPRTEIVRTDVDLLQLLDGKTPPGYEAFIGALTAAANDIGIPCFIRTGHTSGKHHWLQTCYLPNLQTLAQHVAELVEFSECVDVFGLPYKTWVAREFLPLQTAFTAFHGFPVNKERRYFIRGGEVYCHHPYWPAEAVAAGRPADPEWRDKLATLNAETPDEIDELTALSRRVSRGFDGAWSLDWAQTADGRWFAIDMAEAYRSFHWPGCPTQTVANQQQAGASA